MKPSFVGIGAQKCASTWLYDILLDHPEVVLSDRKELDFFSYHYDRGFQWYERHFTACPGTRAVGEISPSYFHEPAVPARVKRYLPDARILVSLRDPVERALSNHRHEVRVGHFVGKDLSFEAGLANNPMYVEQGLYATHLARWLEHFPAERILVVFMEDIIANPATVARGVYQFLGVDPEHRSAGLTRRSNVSHVNRYSSLEKLRKGLRTAAKAAGLERVWKAAGLLGLQTVYHRINRLPSGAVVPPISEVTLRELRQRFQDEVRRLESLSHRTLTHWC